MAELSFGEKLLIARKQLDLYQYQMAERLGVHPNSITKYERGEGKPHAAVVRMFELLCEQQGIHFDEYEAAQQDKGEAMKIVLAEKVSPATLAVFAAEPGWEVLTHDKLPDGLPAALADADALVVRSAVQVDDALMEHAPKLRVIGRAGVGVDNIDADAATRRGIVVMNTPGANAVAVAELTIGLMLALARKLPTANSTMHAGKWEKKSLQGAELRGKRLGILGLGKIGLEVARRARGFGLEIDGSDPFVSAAVARENGIKLVTLEELFAGSDYLTLHVGLTPQTTGIINAKTLAAMKKGVRIINCARGELVDEAALVAALKSGQVDICMIGYPFGLYAKNAGFNLLFHPAQSEYGLFPNEVVAARGSWLKDARNRRVAVDFLRALNEGQQLARENAAAAKRALRRFTRVDDDGYLQGSFEYYRGAFPPSLRVIERAMANALKFVDHPKARQFDVRQSFDNSFIDEAVR